MLREICREACCIDLIDLMVSNGGAYIKEVKKENQAEVWQSSMWRSIWSNLKKVKIWRIRNVVRERSLMMPWVLNVPVDSCARSVKDED